MGDAGCSVGKDGNVTDVEGEADEEEEEWKEDEDEETDGSRTTYRKHEWKVVAVTYREGRIRAAEIIMSDFNIEGHCIHGGSRQ